MKKLLPFFGLLFLILLIGFATHNLSKNKISRSQNEEVSDVHFVKTKITLPEFSFSELLDDSQSFSKKDLVGKYSLINFFASWCTTCLAEHEILLRLRDEKIIDIYGVAWRDINENTKIFLDRNGNPYKKIAKATAGLFTKITGIKAIPETLIIDPQGNVVMRYRGNLQHFNIEEIKNYIK